MPPFTKSVLSRAAGQGLCAGHDQQVPFFRNVPAGHRHDEPDQSDKYDRFDQSGCFAQYSRFSQFSRFSRFSQFSQFSRFSRFSQFSRFNRFSQFSRFSQFFRNNFRISPAASSTVRTSEGTSIPSFFSSFIIYTIWGAERPSSSSSS